MAWSAPAVAVGEQDGSGGLDGVEANGESQGIGLADDSFHGAFGIEPVK